MLHCAHLILLLHGGWSQQDEPDQTDLQEEDVGELIEDEDTYIVPNRAVQSVDKICGTSHIWTHDKAVQVNTCPCHLRHRDIFEHILNLSTHPECERLEQLKQFLTTELQISEDKPEVLKFMATQAIDYMNNGSDSARSKYISNNLMQCIAYLCFCFRCPEMIKHLIKAYEKFKDKQNITAPRTTESWLPWFPLITESTVLYSARERQRWPLILSFILSAMSSCTVTSVLHQPISRVTKFSKVMYPLLEVPIMYNDKWYTPLGLACVQRRVSVCMTLLQHGAQVLHVDQRQLRYKLMDTIEQPLNIAARDFNRLSVTAGMEEHQFHAFTILKLLMKCTRRVRLRFVDDIGSRDPRKCLVMGSGTAVVLLDSLYKPMIGQWALMYYDGVDTLRQMCRNTVRHCLKRNGCLPHGTRLLPITTDLKEVIMLIK